MSDGRMGSSEAVPGVAGAASLPVPLPIHRRRLLLVAGLILAAFLGLLGRLYHLQVLRHPQVARSSRDMAASYAPLWGMRGDILAADGTLLAREVIEYTAALDPALIDARSLPRVLDLLGRGLGLSDAERRAALRKLDSAPGLRFLPLKRVVPAGLVEELRAAAAQVLPSRERRGVIFTPTHFRHYPRGAFLGSVVGATSLSGGGGLAGAVGLELSLESALAGRDGERKLRCEGRRVDRWFWPGEVDVHPVHGYNATLTIDSRIQGIAEEELEKGLERENAAAGTVVVMDCRSGDILAMVSLPALDPNRFHDYPPRELDERRRNRAVENQYEPGSTIKPFVAAVALEKGLFRKDQRIWDGGRVSYFQKRRVEDVNDHGPLTFAEAVVFSSNIGMARIGLRLGREGLNETLDRFGFGKATGVGLPGEAKGKRTARGRWSETYTSISVSMGYELMVTPIQLCAAYSSLVNGGRLMAPRLLKRLDRGGETREFPPLPVGRPIREETSRRMREVLVEAVERGTGRALKVPGLAFGGKTGTAIQVGLHAGIQVGLHAGNQVGLRPGGGLQAGPGRRGYLGGEYLSSFVAFAPAAGPEVVVLVMIERPRRERHYGSLVAGPVAAEVLRRIFQCPSLRGPSSRGPSVGSAPARRLNDGIRSDGAQWREGKRCNSPTSAKAG